MNTIEYYMLKADFMSAYNSNGHNIELAFWQVANLRHIDIEHIKTVLRQLRYDLQMTNQ